MVQETLDEKISRIQAERQGPESLDEKISRIQRERQGESLDDKITRIQGERKWSALQLLGSQTFSAIPVPEGAPDVFKYIPQVRSSVIHGAADIPAGILEGMGEMARTSPVPDFLADLGIPGMKEFQHGVATLDEKAAKGVRALAQRLAPSTDLERTFLTHTGPEAIGQTAAFGVAGKGVQALTGLGRWASIAVVGATTNGMQEFYTHMTTPGFEDDLEEILSGGGAA